MAVAAAEPVAEGPEQVARQRRDLGVVVPLFFAQQRIEVGAGRPIADLGQALEVIEARAPHLHPFRWQLDNAIDRARNMKISVAQADGADTAVLPERQHDAALRIGEIDEQRLRAAPLHLAHEIENHRQSAQGEEQPTRTAVLAQGMADAVFARHLPIELPEPVAVDHRGVDDELRAVERGPPVGGGLDLQARAGFVVEQFCQPLGPRHLRRSWPTSTRVPAGQVLAGKQVLEHADAERGTAGAEERQFWSPPPCSYPPAPNCRPFRPVQLIDYATAQRRRLDLDQLWNFSPSRILSITLRSACMASPTRLSSARITARTASRLADVMALNMSSV